MTGPQGADADLLASTVAQLLRDHCGTEAVVGARGGWSASLWRVMEDADLTLAGVDAALGGAGGTLGDAATVVRLCGYAGAPAPVAETALVAAPALVACGLAVPVGPLTVDVAAGDAPLRLRGSGNAARVTGVLRRVPYGRIAAAVVALAEDEHGAAAIVAVDPSACELTPAESAASEPRDMLRCEAAPVLVSAPAPPWLDAGWLRRRGALARALLVAGAVERAVDMSVTHAQQREQFGRPIARFQAIQHALALAAEEVCAARAAAGVAVVACTAGDVAVEEWCVAAAKVRTGSAAARCTATAHQVHGAIGVTFEHPLHLVTTRLLSWRDECGTEAEWAQRLGYTAATAGAAALWPAITRSGGDTAGTQAPADPAPPG